MTVSNTQVRVSYTGDGSSKQFPVPYPFYLDTDITVMLGTVKQTNGYSITGGEDANGNPQTGTVIFSTAPASSVAVQFILDVPLTQLVELVDGTSFPSATLNQVNDRAVQALLRLTDRLSRSIAAPDGDVSPQMNLPVAAQRANMWLVFDANGNISVASSLPPGQTLSQSVIGQFLNPQTPAEALALITPVNYFYPPGHVLRYGNNTVPGTTDMTAAIQTAVTAAGYGNYEVYIPAGTYLISRDIAVPMGTQWLQGGSGPFGINVRGSGKTQTIIKFSSTGTFTDGFVLDSGGSIKLGGTVSDILFDGNFATPCCLTLRQTDTVAVRDCIVRRVNGHGVFVDSSLSFKFDNLYFSSCASATQGAFEIDGSINNSTTGVLSKIYISSGNAGAIAGLRIDRAVSIEVSGGACESTGTAIQIGCRATTQSVENISIHGMDFENIGNGNVYIDIGSGLSGGALAEGIKIRDLTGFPSGTASIPYAIRMQNCTGVHVEDTILVQPSGATSYIEMVGTNVSGTVVGEHRVMQGTVTWNWARYNGTQIKSWGPQLRCVLGLIQNGVPVCQHPGLKAPYAGAALSGTGVGILINNAVGGYYSFIEFSNSSPTTVPALQFGEPGMEIFLLATNANTTLTFGNSGGLFRFNGNGGTTIGANSTMVAGRVYHFINDGANGAGGSCWCQV